MKCQYYSLKVGQFEITLEERPTYCNRGRWYAKLFGYWSPEEHVDECHGWPRYYFNKQYAFEELEAWIKKNWQNEDNQPLIWELKELEI